MAGDSLARNAGCPDRRQAERRGQRMDRDGGRYNVNPLAWIPRVPDPSELDVEVKSHQGLSGRAVEVVVA